jgi:HEAT repeat protein
MKRISILLALLSIHPESLALAADRPGTSSSAAVRAQVEQLLSGYEPRDPGEALRRLGPPAAAALLLIARDTSHPLRHLRAIEALGHVPTPEALEFLRHILQHNRSAVDALPVYELAAAARALAGYGPQVERELVPLLAHQSADVREGAVFGLSRLGTEGAVRALRARLLIEKESGVRAALARALQKAQR